MRTLLLLCLVTPLLLAGCSDAVAPDAEDLELAQQEALQRSAPATLLQGDTLPHHPDNPYTAAGLELGHRLFFDTRLSSNRQVSCATCHKAAFASAEGDIALSTAGVTGNPLPRHTPVIFNLAFQDLFFWDGGAPSLEQFILAPLSEPDEMGLDLTALPPEVLEDTSYQRLAQLAFGQDSLDLRAISHALAQYTASLVSANSRYDRWKRGEVQLTPPEQRGFRIFEQHCASCHPEGTFTDNDFHNIGLDPSSPLSTEDPKAGRYRITGNPQDLGAYKTPTLRNLAFSAPYMHDGRFPNLFMVVDFYAQGPHDVPNLPGQLRALNEGPGMPLSLQDRSDLLAFLNTLNDSSFAQQLQPPTP